MSSLENTFTIETPSFILIHSKLNTSTLPLNMNIENNSFNLPGFYYLTNTKNHSNIDQLITLRVNYYKEKTNIENFSNLFIF